MNTFKFCWIEAVLLHIPSHEYILKTKIEQVFEYI